MADKINSMANEPYSIYVNKRPQRTIFLVDPKKLTLKQLDKIFEFNRREWGGRFNPIVFTDGKKIKDEWWPFLNVFDPDVIKSLVPIEKKLVETVDRFLSPYLFEVPRGRISNDEDFHLHEHGIGISPSKKSVYKVARAYQPIFAFFDLGNLRDKELRRFIETNFGTVNESQSFQAAMEGMTVKKFTVTSVPTLATALTELSSGFQRYIFPIQLSATHDPFPDVPYSDNARSFTVIVGDSTKDLVNFWNRISCVQDYMRKSLKQFWLPTKFANDQRLDEPLRRWFEKMGETDGSGPRRVRFVTLSISNQKLEALAQKYRHPTLNLIATHEKLSGLEMPNLEERRRHLFSISNEMDSFKVAGGSEEMITVHAPEEVTEASSGRYWMADVHIQFDPNRYANYVGKDFWWRFPKCNRIAHYLFGKEGPARICLGRFPAVCMAGNKVNLKISLLDESSIFRIAVLGDSNHWFDWDARKGLKQEYYGDMQRSDKGRYFSGLIEIFKGLYSAFRVLEEKYWRRMFDLMSNADPQRDQNRKVSVRAKLAKGMNRFGTDFQSNGRTDGLDWLTEYFMQILKEESSEGREIRFDIFLEEARKELHEYNLRNQRDTPWPFRKTDVKNALTDLTERGIISIGHRPYCPLCGSPNWYSVDEVRQELKCKGCAYGYHLRPEEEYYYRLNSRVQAACAKHGLVPLVLVLGELLDKARTSFIYTASHDLFKKRNAKPETDLDVLCVQDGKLIIGEIKKSCGLFKKSHITDMAKIAKKIKADKLIFSSLNERPTANVKGWIQEVAKQLKPFGIEAEWHQITSYRFHPSPVR